MPELRDFQFIICPSTLPKNFALYHGIPHEHLLQYSVTDIADSQLFKLF